MSRYADPDRCPDCRATLPPVSDGRPACPSCGLPLQGDEAVELFSTLQHADRLVESLRAGAVAPVAAPRPAPAAEPAVTIPPLQMRPAGQQRRWTVPAVLLTLGALCLVVGALVFLAVTWSVLGVGGRTAVLVGLTLVAAVGAWLSSRRSLRGAAETFATVAVLFLALDLAGAASAGWFGEAAPATTVLLSALVVLVAPTLGNQLVARTPTGALVAPQLVGSLAALVAAIAAVARWDDHVTTVTVAAVLLAAGAALGSRRLGQHLLAFGTGAVSVLMWALLVLVGVAQVLDAWSRHGRGAATWSDVTPLLAAAGIAVAVVVITLRTTLAPAVAFVPVVAASWLVAAAVGAVLAGSVTAVVVVAVGAAALVAALATVVAPLRRALGTAATGLAGVGVIGALTALAVLVDGIGAEVVRQLDAPSSDLWAVADLAAYDDDVAAPWTIPLAVLVLTVALVVALGRTPGDSWRRPAISLAVPVLAVTALCYAPVLLLVVGAAIAVAALHVLPATRPWRPEVDWPLAAAWTLVAATVALYDPLPLTLVALAATVVVGAVAARTGGHLAQVALAPLVAASVGSAGWLLGVPGEWTVAAAIVAVGLVATVVGTLPIGVSAGLATCLLLVPIGSGEADASGGPTDQWLAAYLTLTAAGAAAVAIRRRSREAAWVAALLGVAATWVRLGGAGVGVPEAYALPLAAVLLAFGGWEWRHDRSLGTMRTLAPGLGVALVPTLVACLGEPTSLRALLLAVACAALVALGAIARLRAPFLAGAVTGAALVVVELAPFHDAVPRWVLLTVAGTCLVLAGVRWEYLAGVGRRSWGRLQDLA